MPIEVISLDARCWNALVSYLRYVGKLFWPSDLAVIYPYVFEWPPGSSPSLWVCLPGVTSRALFPPPRALFPGRLVLVPGNAGARGRVGPGWGAGDGRPLHLYSLHRPFPGGLLGCAATARRRPLRKPVLVAAAAVALCACAVLTRAQVACWRDGVSLFEHAIAVTTNNATAHNALGTALAAKNRLDEAIAHYTTALQINPDYGLAHNNLGVALARLGRYDGAVAHYQSALETNPKDVEAHFNLANAFNPGFQDESRPAGTAASRHPDGKQAREHYLSALAIDPSYVNARINLGNLEASEGNFDAAIRCYQERRCRLILWPRWAISIWPSRWPKQARPTKR